MKTARPKCRVASHRKGKVKGTMEAFYASVSGVITAFGSLIFFFILLRKDILRVEDRVIRMEDRVIRMDDRLRDVEGDMKVVKHQVRIMEGDMKVVKHQVRITKGPPADPEPTQTPARD